MKKIISVLLSLALACVVGVAAVGCGSNGDDGSTTPGTILLYTREAGSGTRDAFMELVGLEEITENAAICQGTNVVLTSVGNAKGAIGYISLGSLTDTVKSVRIDNVAATSENIIDGSYKLSRPFNVAYKQSVLESNATLSDLLVFIASKQGQEIVESYGCVSETRSTAPDYTAPASKPTQNVQIGGSTSVGPLMEKLVEGYCKASGVDKTLFSVTQNGSGAGMTGVADGTFDLGMASRDVKADELAKGLTPKKIALDGIAVIVNKSNAAENLTIDQLKKVYAGEITAWSELGA